MTILRSDNPWGDGRAAYCVAAQPVGALLFRGCVIRFEDVGDGPYILADGSHRCVGVGEVRVDGNGKIEILAKDAATPSVVTMHVTTDETFAKAGFFVGPSGGAGTTVPMFGHRDGGTYHGLTPGLYGTGRNIWCSWWSLA